MAGMMLDNQQSAMQAQAGDPDSETFVQIVAALRKHVFGPGEQGILQAIKDADDPGRVLGEIVYALVREAATQAEEAGKELDMNILMGVATELIDDITDLLEGHGIEITDQQREYALLFAQQLYVDNSNPDNDDRNAAKQALSMYREEGAVDTAVKYVQQRGTEAGVDPFGVEQMGGEPGMMGEK